MSDDFDYSAFKECCDALISTYKESYISKSNTHIDYLLDNYVKDVYRRYLTKKELSPNIKTHRFIITNIQKYRVKLEKELEEIRKS